jgi:hypothetical protein
MSAETPGGLIALLGWFAFIPAGIAGEQEPECSHEDTEREPSRSPKPCRSLA